MIVEASCRDRSEHAEDRSLAEAAAAVVVATDAWLEGGLCPATGLALVQNALPLTAGDDDGSRLQRRSHARAVVGLLLLVDGDGTAEAGDLAVRLHALLDAGSAGAGTDGGDHPEMVGAG
ncbi:hypothetical protein WCD74_29410 [Actinomycetospora sp. OC33-EN08]|uniref:Uncharacterized protein n=1 Tax=Actinomycetospora aurantiaca TaxID=3129233 RepID=A0ABU8MX61_9PSEU